MGSNSPPKVLLFGAGSVGAVYLYLLSKVASVTAVCRSNYEVVKKDGFLINSAIYGQNIHFTPRVIKSCAEASALDEEPFDYIIVCSKAIPSVIPELIRPAVTPGRTVVVLMQNGIGIEDEYVDAFPATPIVSCVVYLPATQRPAGVIKHGDFERLEIGNYPASASVSHARNFAELMRSAGATADLFEDVQTKRWFKLLANASWNPLCALTLCTDVELMASSPSATDLVLDIMLEVADIAKAYGHAISREEVEYQLGRAKDRASKGIGIEPSMLQDVREGRKMEVETIVGNTVRLAKAKGVGCEKLEMLYVLAVALDLRISGK